MDESIVLGYGTTVVRGQGVHVIEKRSRNAGLDDAFESNGKRRIRRIIKTFLKIYLLGNQHKTYSFASGPNRIGRNIFFFQITRN